jgi:hypothetical protein
VNLPVSSSLTAQGSVGPPSPFLFKFCPKDTVKLSSVRKFIITLTCRTKSKRKHVRTSNPMRYRADYGPQTQYAILTPLRKLLNSANCSYAHRLTQSTAGPQSVKSVRIVLVPANPTGYSMCLRQSGTASKAHRTFRIVIFCQNIKVDAVTYKLLSSHANLVNVLSLIIKGIATNRPCQKDCSSSTQ